jgi:SAM-dependent methyltransferase
MPTPPRSDDTADDRADMSSDPARYYASLEKERTPCDLCGRTEQRILGVGDRYGMGLTTVGCVRCGLIFTNPRPVEPAMRDFYRSHYRAFYEGVDRPSEEYVRSGIFPRRAEAAYRRLSRRLDLDRVGRVLDVGCSEGSLLKLLRERHPETELHGVEPVAAFARFAAERAGAGIHVGDLEDYCERGPGRAAAGSYDLVLLSHVLEHVHRPSEQLSRVHGLLAVGGHLYVEVPNIASPHGALGQFHIAHLYHFYPETLQAMLVKNGFRAIELTEEGLPDPWAMCVLARRDRPREPDWPSTTLVEQRERRARDKLPSRSLLDRLDRRMRRLVHWFDG